MFKLSKEVVEARLQKVSFANSPAGIASKDPTLGGTAAAMASMFSRPPRNGKSGKVLVVQDTINKEILGQIKETFRRADRDGNSRLSCEEFVAAFMGVLQTDDGTDAVALEKLFMRVDANADGTVDWDEFSGYMLMESQGSANIRSFESSMAFHRPEPNNPQSDAWAHRDTITHMSVIRPQNGGDRYVTCGKDGTVKIWNPKDMRYLKTISLGRGWVTCAKMMPLSQKLAVASFSRSMKIFDLSSFELCGQIPEIDYAPMSMDVWVPKTRKDVEMVVFGDGGGFVRLFEVKLNPLEEKTSSDRYVETPRWCFRHHTDWVTRVKYVEDMNCVIAASLDKTLSITDAEERMPSKMLHGHQKGVNSCDWSSMYKFVCSCGQDKKIILWNPFSLKPLATLSGHVASVTEVLVNEQDNQIISIGSDKTIKVWDIRNHKCLQTVFEKEKYQEDIVAAALWDAPRRQLVTGNTKPKSWRQVQSSASSNALMAPITGVLFNPHFGEAVSADLNGTISVWHIGTGRLRFRFNKAHGDSRLTAMAFDSNKRRLITGAEDGALKVWNYSSGKCISTLSSRHGQEVTSIAVTKGQLMKHILAAGWDKKVTFYEDANNVEVAPSRSMGGHRADILGLALLEGTSTLVTAAYDGEIWAWNIESGAPKRKMVPVGLFDRPPNERAAEAIAFLAGKLKGVLVSVSADRCLRMWEALSGTCLLEVFTGHKYGETVAALALCGKNQHIVTGDSAGYVKVWDMSEFTGHLAPRQAAEEVLVEVALWRAHRSGITALQWFELKQGYFILTSSSDCTINLWRNDGAHVGTFATLHWQLDDTATWRSLQAAPLTGTDQQEMEASRQQSGCLPPPQRGRNGSSLAPLSYIHRPSSAPSEVAKVCEAAYIQRFETIGRVTGQMRRGFGITSPPTAGGSGAAASASLLRSRDAGGSGGASTSSFSAFAAAGAQEDGGEGVPPTEASLGGSGGTANSPWGAAGSSGGGVQYDRGDGPDDASSSSCESDIDVPVSLWLEEFDMARRGKLASSGGREQRIHAPAGSSHNGLNHAGTSGRKEGDVAHLLHLSNLNSLQQRPHTSYGGAGTSGGRGGQASGGSGAGAGRRR